MNMTPFKPVLVLALLLAPCIGTAASISLTPNSGILNTSRWDGKIGGSNSNPAFLAFVAAVTTSPELYKQETPGAEEKALSGSYTTTVVSASNKDLKNSAGKITYDGGDFVTSTLSSHAYIGFKDGNHSPYYYLFDLTALGWTGTEEISWSGFWPKKGEISHVSLFGKIGSQIPPPPPPNGQVPDGGTTFVTLGVALLGLGSMRRLLAAKA